MSSDADRVRAMTDDELLTALALTNLVEDEDMARWVLVSAEMERRHPLEPSAPEDREG